MSAPNLATTAPGTWEPNPAAGAAHWTAYCKANNIDPATWEAERRPPAPVEPDDLAVEPAPASPEKDPTPDGAP